MLHIMIADIIIIPVVLQRSRTHRSIPMSHLKSDIDTDKKTLAKRSTKQTIPNFISSVRVIDTSTETYSIK